MKKIIPLILVLTLLCMAFSVLAQDGGKMEPLFATVGDALAAAGEYPIAGGEEDYYAVVTEIDGKYYRSVAVTDDRYRELQRATAEADSEQLDAAFAELNEYIKTLPIVYSEEFTAVPFAQADLDALAGKTIGELLADGFEDRQYGTDLDENEEIRIVYYMRYGLFEYRCVVDTDFDTFQNALDEQSGAENDFVITDVSLAGITNEAFSPWFHADGTIEDIPDPFAGFSEFAADFQELIGKIQNGEEADLDEFFDGMKEKYPDLVNMIDMYQGLYRLLGTEQLADMLIPAE